MGLGAALRVAAIGSVPAGLYQDEAFNGLDALRVLLGEHPLYFTANNGREPLFIYLASMSIASLGRTVAAVRLPAALLGTLTIPATAALGNSLFNRRVGLLASGLVAITFWHLHLSRVAFRAVGLPLFLALAVAAGWHGTRRDSRAWILTGGLLYGLAFYTYLPVYFTPPVLALFSFYLWATGHKAPLRRAIPWFALGTVIALAPLASTILADPSILFGRVAQVSILDPGLSQSELWSAAIRQAGKGLGMYFWSGDTIPRHNLPGRPVFDPLIAPFFVIGALWGIWNWRRPAAALTVLWTFLMLAPTVLAEDTPHFLRGVGVLPMACLLPAVGLDRSRLWLISKRIGRWTAVVLVLLILAASLALTLRDYWRYASDPLTGIAFQSAAVELAGEMTRFEGDIWASDRFLREWESVPYLIGDRRVHWLSEGEEPRPTSWPTALFLWPYEPLEPLLAALPAGVSLQGWRGPLIKGDLEPSAYPLYWGYRLEPAGEMPESVASFQDNINLGEVTIIPAAPARADESTLQVILTWHAVERPKLDYQVFVHVTDTAGIVAQDDSGPAEGTLPATWWRPGDSIVDRHTLVLPAPYDRAQHVIAVGLYHNEERLSVLDSVLPVVDDALILTGTSDN
jgi:4-amino-4-deoxy-L-arabinose transferase-like glycosyltransferase